MRSAGCGPRIFTGAEEPDGVGGEACGFCRTGDQNGCIFGFRREEGFIHRAIEGSEKFAPRNSATIETE